MDALQEKINKSKKTIAKLEARIKKAKENEAYENFFHRRHSFYVKKVSYLRDELNIEKSLLYRLEDK